MVKLTLFQAGEKIFDFKSVSADKAPNNYSDKRFDEIVQSYKLVFNEEPSLPAVYEYISIHRDPQGRWSYYDLSTPLLAWLKHGNICSITR